MERIDLFDRYINDQLSEKEKQEFDARLKNDTEFASEFHVYLFTVNGVCREAHQDNLDFGIAMKHLTKEQLQEIVGEPSASQHSRKASPKQRFALKNWGWQVVSIAAVVVIAFTVVFNIERNARYSVDNAIYACADINIDVARSGAETIDINKLNNDELKEKLPQLESLYKNAWTLDEVAEYGFALAMSYLRLHDRDKAKATLQQLVDKFSGNEDFAESVAKWRSILDVLK